MDAGCDRAGTAQLSAVYDQLFRSSAPLAKLKDASFAGRLLQQPSESQCIPGRSIAWKLFLVSADPLPPPPDSIITRPPLEAIRKLRAQYAQLLKDKMRAPDGSYEDGFSIPGVTSLPRGLGDAELGKNLEHNNPLSLSEQNPWTDWFAAVELRNTIRQDVERTFPDMTYFRAPDVQAQLTSILYIQSVMHPDIGYRQGMHELLALIFYTVDFDSLAENEDVYEDLKDVCSRTWVSADAWALFSIVMQGVGPWYEWREPALTALPTPLNAQFRLGGKEGPLDLKPYVAPIVQTCQYLQDTLLKTSDPILWQSMQTSGIEPQIYGIRWLRLLFTREFEITDALLIWDGIFASEARFELVPWLCVAMLIRIRNQLIPGDYSEKLTCLLRYPRVSSGLIEHPSVLLLKQAQSLHTTPSASTGASIMIENRNLLNIPLAVPEPEAPTRRRMRQTDRPRDSSRIDVGPNSSNAGQTNRHRKEESGTSPYMANMELFARGLLEKSENLGINRSVMNAVTELRKNFPDLPLPLRSPSAGTTALASYPLVDERPPEERPPWEPRSRFEVEKDMAQLRALHKKLHESVAYIVDALLQDEGEHETQDHVVTIQEKKREAIESLAYVRDVLSGSVTDIDEERLFGEAEYRHRKEKARKDAEETAALQRRSPNTPGVPPIAAALAPVTPALAVDTRQRPTPYTRGVFDEHSSSQRTRSPETASLSWQAATLPRRPSSSGPRPPVPAPWHSTRSNFSTPSYASTTLPRRPPPTSSILPGIAQASSPILAAADQAPRERQVSHDPLGALPGTR